jgi:hypothetical protein
MFAFLSSKIHFIKGKKNTTNLKNLLPPIY